MTIFMTNRSAAIPMAAFCLALYCLAPGIAVAQSAALPGAAFATVSDKPAILFDAPSSKANRNFILSPFLPLEVLVKLDKWTKVRDSEGAIGWVENSAIGDRRFVQVTANAADIRAAASPTAAIVFEAQRGVLLEVTGAATDIWLPVRHRDGQAGYVRSSQLWGG